eukprot:m.21299 g.21299  ORF g.21299 m.21299 type:complete len:538 (+) comp8052_c0_seq2:69-1682(+)
MARRTLLNFDSDDDSPLSQTDNSRPRSASADLFSAPKHEGASGPAPHLATRRTINDRIHGQIELEPVLVAVIDTPQFQRLRSLKQLGAGEYVFPGACHTRFEHSIGVSFLAGQMVNHLMVAQPELAISEQDRVCVRLAGLCHDLGHGPFSHMFERFVNRKRKAAYQRAWEHEQASVLLFRMLLRNNAIRLEDYGLSACDEMFVVHLIEGLKPTERWPEDIGRDASKRFLFDIVANKRNGIDVDKLDYFMRDSTAAFGRPPIGCDVQRLIQCSKVLVVDGQAQVCFEEKMALGLTEIFRLRAWLHKYVYQHHTVKVIDDMICDILHLADPHFRVTGSEGVMRTLSESVDDMVAFSKLGDWVLNAIEASAEPGLQPAQERLARLRRRDLYQAVHVPMHVPPHVRSEEQARELILDHADAPTRAAIAEDLVVHFVSIDYGSRDAHGDADNPVLHVRFFNPKSEDPTDAYALSDKKMSELFTPRAYSERLLYVCTRSEAAHAAIEVAYRQWRAAEALRQPAVGLTPLPIANTSSPRKRVRK